VRGGPSFPSRRHLVIGVVIIAIGVLGVWMLDKPRPVA
jgi:hypothetical protein